jgi:hypothetical protein
MHLLSVYIFWYRFCHISLADMKYKSICFLHWVGNFYKSYTFRPTVGIGHSDTKRVLDKAALNRDSLLLHTWRHVTDCIYAVLDFRFLQQWLWRVIFWDVTCCSPASSPKFQRNTLRPSLCLLLAGFLLGLLFDPEGGDRLFLWNVGQLLHDHMMSHHRRWYFSVFQLFVRALFKLCV